MPDWLDWAIKGGAGAVLLKIIDELVKWLSGKHQKEQTGWEQRDIERRKRDREAKARRTLEEYVHLLRKLLIELGKSPPDWPTYTTGDHPLQDKDRD